MAGWFGKVIKGLLLGVGTVLSIIPGGVAIGAPLIVDGTAIRTREAGTSDILSAYAYQLTANDTTITAMQRAANRAAFWSGLQDWISRNTAIVLIAVGVLLFFLFKRQR